MKNADVSYIKTLAHNLSWKHPIRSANDLLGIAGVGIKHLAEEVGVPVYGTQHPNYGAKTRNMLENERAALA